MSQEKTQAATEEKVDEVVEAAPDAGAEGAQEPNIDDLLGEFNAGQETTPEPDGKDKSSGPEAYDDVRALLQRAERDDLHRAVQGIKGDLDVDDDIVEGYLHKRATDDPRLQQVWANRHADPASWARVQAALGTEFGRKFSARIDAAVTEDKAAIANAVRGQSTETPNTDDVPDFKGKSDVEFHRWLSTL